MDVLKTLSRLVTGRLHVADRLLMQILEPRLAALGITLAEFRVVGQLLGHERGLSQVELAQQLLVKAPTLSVVLRGLETKGAIERVTDPDDARVKRVRTARRIPRMAQIVEALVALETEATRGLTRSDLATTRKTLERIIHNLQSAVED